MNNKNKRVILITLLLFILGIAFCIGFTIGNISASKNKPVQTEKTIQQLLKEGFERKG